MAKIMEMTYYLIFIGALVVNVMSYNPMLTYTIRFKKIQVHHNISIDDYKIDRYKEGEFVNDGINCEYFQTWAVTDICNKLKEKNQVWSRWCGSYDPPLVCPLNKVTYQMKNATVDVGSALLLYPLVTDYQWKLFLKFYSDDIYVGSTVMEFYFFGYRKKIKSILKP